MGKTTPKRNWGGKREMTFVNVWFDGLIVIAGIVLFIFFGWIFYLFYKHIINRRETLRELLKDDEEIYLQRCK